MARVVQVPSEGAPKEGENCLIVARDATGKFHRFITYKSYEDGAGTSNHEVDEDDLREKISGALIIADRTGIPVVYVDRR